MKTGHWVIAAGVVAGLSLLVVEPTPSYDPWAWLLWGRELAHGTLSTAEGPAFKPLPVAVCALLAPLGDEVAPTTWVWLVRFAAVLAIGLAFVLGRRLAGGSLLAGAGAALAVGLCAGFPDLTATGTSEAPLCALALAGVAAWQAGRPRLALAAALGCCLLRVEAWPFAALLGLWMWRQDPRDRPLLVGAALLVPVAWFVPEWIGSGDLLRSGSRARVPNPGQPALADFPAWESLREAVKLPLWPLWLGVAGLAVAAVRRDAASQRALIPVAAGLAWIALVALMAQAGFSGEPRYALPGAALIGIGGAAGLAMAPRTRAAPWLTAAAAVLLLVAALPRLADLSAVRRHQAYAARLSRRPARRGRGRRRALARARLRPALRRPPARAADGLPARGGEADDRLRAARPRGHLPFPAVAPRPARTRRPARLCQRGQGGRRRGAGDMFD